MNYNNETCLLDMLLTQLEFQKQLLIKRHIVSPDDVNADNYIKLNAACYHATCTNVELAEFVKQYLKDAQTKTEEVMLELTDAFTFLLNQFLYINVIPTKTLEHYYTEAKYAISQYEKQGQEISYYMIIGQFNIAVGELYHKTRYKSWKTYTELNDDIYSLIPLVDNILTSFLQLYVKLNADCEEICKYFYQKHEINVKRQEAGGKYETV